MKFAQVIRNYLSLNEMTPISLQKHSRNTISTFRLTTKYGLTATPFQKGNDSKIILPHLGDIIASFRPRQELGKIPAAQKLS